MKVFGISNHGLAVIAALIVVLWGVILLERSVNQRAQREFDELRRSWRSVPALNELPRRPAFEVS